MQKRFLRKLAAMAVAVAFAVSLLPAALSAGVADFNDVAGHWGVEHLTKMIEAGVIAGDGKGNAMPDKPIERCEAAIMLSKSFGLNHLDLADVVTGNYTDITAASLYVEEYINNIIAAGFMIGSGDKFESGNPIPREEAFTALRNAFQIPDAPEAFESSFPDFEDVSVWAEGHILAMEAAGMIAGKNGKIAPADVVTRAEFAALLSKGVGLFIDEDTDFEDAELERAFIRNPDLTVKNLVIEVLTIAQGVGDGDVTLENCDVGTLFVRGGGEESIHLIDTNVTELIIDTAVTGAVRIVVDEDSLVEKIVVYSEDATIVIDGSVLDIDDQSENGCVIEDGNGGDDDNDDSGVTVGTVNASVKAAAAADEDTITVTLTGALDYEDNVFLARSASDFATVVGKDGRPLASVLDGAFTAIELNVKEIMAAAGFDLVDILQTNPALSAYPAGGSITEDGGVWSKATADRIPADFDDEFCVLVLGGKIATLVFTDADSGDELTIVIDASGLTVNGPVDEYATVNAVHESVTAAVAYGADGITVTLTGELDCEDNVFLARSASDFETLVDAEGRPLDTVLDGAFTAIEINVKEIMAAIGFELVDILQVNLALSAYPAGGNITEKDGEWSKETAGRVPADFDDEFCVLVLGGETATLLFVCEGEAYTITIDATALVINGAVA